MSIDKKFYQAVSELDAPFSHRQVMEKTGFAYGAAVNEMKKLVSLGMAIHVNDPPFTYRLIDNPNVENIDAQHIAAPNEIIRCRLPHHNRGLCGGEPNVKFIKH